jgi:hypothetical protein
VGIFEEEGDETMGRKMVVRILSISIALLFLSVFAPSLTKGAVYFNPTAVEFGEVEVGSQGSQLLSITNTNSGPVEVLFGLSYENGVDCGFSLAYGGEPLTPDPNNGYIYLPEPIGANGSVNVEVIFAPSEPATCSATLLVSAGGLARISLSGTGVAAPQVTNIIIDGQETGVLDFEYEGKLFSLRLEEIAAQARNHGQYVRWVVFWTRRAHRDDKLDKDEMKAIRKAAAHANIPPRTSGLEDLEYNGEPVTDLIEACKENAGNNREYVRCVYQLMKELKKEGVIKTRKEKHQIRRYAARLRFRGGR